MIDPKAVVSYAQFNEDIILAALLNDVEKGFYIDIGANYPTVDSVTKYFYDMGWSGINVEPVKSLHSQLVKSRPRDINLNCGIGNKNSQATLREYTDIPGHSTFDDSQKSGHSAQIASRDYKTQIRTLSSIFKSEKVGHTHFIKIDVEGYEYEVVSGNDWSKYRPEIICIEANHITKNWRPILTSNKYKSFIFDGLNEYFVAEESWSRTNNFVERAVEISYHTLKQHQWQSWSEDSKMLVSLTTAFEAKEKELKATAAISKELGILSMTNKSYKRRLFIAAYGLTVDWINLRLAKKTKQ